MSQQESREATTGGCPGVRFFSPAKMSFANNSMSAMYFNWLPLCELNVIIRSLFAPALP
jgi:hypothetical protein